MKVLGEEQNEGFVDKVTPRIGLVLMLLVSFILLLSSFYTAEASIFRKARENVLDATAPILSILSVPINAMNTVFGKVGDYFNVVEENRTLRAENAELRQWMEEALALRDLVSVYEKLQSYQPPPEVMPIDAYVIGDSNDVFAKSMVVNAGTTKQVEIGHAVVNEAGLIGRIIESGDVASRVLLLTDIQSRIPVYIERVDIEGILVGRTGDDPVINFTSEVLIDPIAPGARVLTSGAGGVIPRGISVGVVKDVTAQDITIDLYADYSQTRLVRILDYDFPEVTTQESDDQASRLQTETTTIPDPNGDT